MIWEHTFSKGSLSFLRHVQAKGDDNEDEACDVREEGKSSDLGGVSPNSDSGADDPKAKANSSVPAGMTFPATAISHVDSRLDDRLGFSFGKTLFDQPLSLSAGVNPWSSRLIASCRACSSIGVFIETLPACTRRSLRRRSSRNSSAARRRRPLPFPVLACDRCRWSAYRRRAYRCTDQPHPSWHHSCDSG